MSVNVLRVVFRCKIIDTFQPIQPHIVVDIDIKVYNALKIKYIIFANKGQCIGERKRYIVFPHCFLLVLVWCTRGTLLYFARKTSFLTSCFPSLLPPSFEGHGFSFDA